MIVHRLIFAFLISSCLAKLDNGVWDGVYELRSTTEIFESSDQATLKPFESQATLEIVLIKQESFKTLYNLKVSECHPIMCSVDSSDYYVAFENETITGIYGKFDNSSSWTVGLSFASLLQQRLDVPRINVPGVCQSNNEIINEQKRIRNIKFCNYGTQHAVVKALSARSQYEQNVIYESSDKKVNKITAMEKYSVGLPLGDKAAASVITKVTVLLKGDSDRSDNLQCTESSDVNSCLNAILKKTGYKFISENAEKLLTAYMFDRFTPDQALSDLAGCTIGTAKDFEKLYHYSEKSAPKNFLRLLKLVELADKDQLLSCLKNSEQKRNLNALISLYAVSGTLPAYNAVKEFLSNETLEHNIMILRDTYLNSLTHAPYVDRAIIVNVLADFSASKPVDKMLATTGAAILRRYCSKIAGCEDKSGATKQLIKHFETKFQECASDDEECQLTMIRSFANLRTPHVVPLVKPLLCSGDPIGVEVLRLLRALHPSYWSTSDILPQLWLIYHNRCKALQTQTVRTLAAELLLSSYEDKAVVVKNLLNVFSSGNFSVEKEILSYVLSRIKHLSKTDDRIEDALNDLELKKQFFYYNFLTNGAKSTAVTGDLFDIESGKGTYSLEMEFYKGILKRSDFNIRLEPYDSMPASLMSFGLFSDGLDSVASVLGGGEEIEEASSIQPAIPTAGMKLNLFENDQLPVTFFAGEGELMSAVWSSNGDSMTAYEDNFKINDLRTVLPMLNGYSLKIDFQSALSMKISGSIEVSIWYRTSHSVVSDKRSFSIIGQMSLLSAENDVVFQDDLNLSGKVGVDVITEVDFYANPIKMCLQLDQSPFSIKYKTNHKLMDLKKRHSKESIQHWHRSVVNRIQGRCFATVPSMTKACNSLDNQ